MFLGSRIHTFDLKILEVKSIKFFPGYFKKVLRVGDIFLASVKKRKKKIKYDIKKKIFKCLLIHSKKNFLRKNGNFINFDNNCAIILHKKRKLKLKRLKKIILYEFFIKKFKKIALLSHYYV